MDYMQPMMFLSFRTCLCLDCMNQTGASTNVADAHFCGRRFEIQSDY